jgi:hypothetical protein
MGKWIFDPVPTGVEIVDPWPISILNQTPAESRAIQGAIGVLFDSKEPSPEKLRKFNLNGMKAPVYQPDSDQEYLRRWVRNVVAVEPARVARFDNVPHVRFSPDGKQALVATRVRKSSAICEIKVMLLELFIGLILTGCFPSEIQGVR